MPARIPDNLRAAILTTIRAGGKSCRGIARDHNVSEHLVRKVAKENGITDAWSRVQTENATRARVADMAAQRAQLAQDLLVDVARLRHRAWTPYPVVVNTADGPETIHLPLPPLRDVQAAYTSVGISVDKHLGLVRHDADPGTDTARNMLGVLAAGLGVAYERLQQPAVDDP